ncbi:MAG: magnesium/cobalt transporter CorA [Chloroflexi bacterium]|nr:magnesium/cobalt transporter CorA [Chloroflexota bacterium]
MSITQINLETGSTIALTRAAPRPLPPARGGTEGGIVWLDIPAPSEDDLNWLARAYDFHPLALEDCRNFDQRAKVDAYDGYLFLSLHAVTRVNGDLQTQELQVFLGGDYLITVHREPIAALDAMCARCASDSRTGSYRVDMLLYQIVDQMVDAIFPLLDTIEDEIDELEDEILDKPNQESLHRVFDLKRQLVYLRKIVGPLRDAMDTLADSRYEFIDPRTALYYRDTYDHLVRIYDLIETSRDLLGNALDAYLSTVSNRLNEVMKRLTLITTIFMPISFIVGFGGMNFKQLPFDNPMAFGILVALLVAMPTLMMIWFWRSRWM